MPPVHARVSLRLLPVLLTLASGCRETLPSLLLYVEDPEALAPTQLRVTVQGEGLEPATVTRPEQAGAPLSGGQTLRVLLPESAVGRTARLTVEALRAGEPIGQGEGQAVVARGQETGLRVTVRALASCPGGECGCDAQTCPEGCCQQGRCVQPSREACGSAGAACTACSGDTVDRCTGGACRCGADLPCSDGYRCEEGRCLPRGEGPACTDASACTTPPGQCFAAQGTCTEGTCHYAPRAQGEGCDDGEACTGNDACDGEGRCVGQATVCTTPPGGCHESSGACFSGACQYAARPPDSPCDDGNACTAGDVCNGAGACAGTQVTCTTPPGQCYQPTGTCAGGTCTYAPRGQGEGCDDGDACTTNDTCNGAGGCAGTPVVCNSPPNSCYASSGTCSGGTCTYGFASAGTPCGSGGNECRSEACNGSGACVATNEPDGITCNGGCFSCRSGSCQYDCRSGQLCCPWDLEDRCVTPVSGHCPPIP